MTTTRILYNNRIVEVQQTLYDLAIIYEHTNLAKSNTKKQYMRLLCEYENVLRSMQTLN